ncbi:MAG: SDR family oxidoreductase [Clostridiaceae bacterium]|nr:SDR family oxidoreductase [Clostridiaceae bacterium]
MKNQVILITGASSGIGRATAEYFMKKGYRVYGTSRNPERHQNHTYHESSGFINMIPLDVADDNSVENAINTVLAKEGKIDVLISNAGIGIAGSIEDTTMEEVKKQFEINFFGSLRVIKAVLPVMRKQGYGKIIALSSVAGVISIPYQAHYSSSKFAIEGLVEALRYEVAPFNIKVCLIEPGDTKTEFTSNRVYSKNANQNSPYYDTFNKSLARMERDEQNGCTPESVAKTIYKMAIKKNPPIRIAVGFQYKLVLFLKKILPARVLEKVVGMLYS